MGKISPVSAKYIVHATIDIEGVVDRPDVIGAIFGQTEGLLGADLELRELQRSGRIGRIEVTSETHGGKTAGKIFIPSSLDKAETAIVAAAIEVIQRIGPCNAKIKVENIEDVRISKRKFVLERAKELLSTLINTMQPDSQELADEVAYSVRVMEITEYGKDRLPAGPGIDEGDEVIVVEGRADVLNLLKHGFKNCIAMNGTHVPQTIIDLSKEKTLTIFADGDRGGDLNIKEMLMVAEVDFVTKAPDGKEVEELTKKEIHKSLRNRIAAEQAKLEFGKDVERLTDGRIKKVPNDRPDRPANNMQQQRSPMQQQRPMSPQQRPMQQQQRPMPIQQRTFSKGPEVDGRQKDRFRNMLEDLLGTKGAYIIDDKLTVLGKVPISELIGTIKSLPNIYAIVMDGSIEKDLAEAASKSNVRCIVGMDSKVSVHEAGFSVLTISDL